MLYIHKQNSININTSTPLRNTYTRINTQMYIIYYLKSVEQKNKRRLKKTHTHMKIITKTQTLGCLLPLRQKQTLLFVQRPPVIFVCWCPIFLCKCSTPPPTPPPSSSVCLSVKLFTVMMKISLCLNLFREYTTDLLLRYGVIDIYIYSLL